jgi:hypothetical protein
MPYVLAMFDALIARWAWRLLEPIATIGYEPPEHVFRGPFCMWATSLPATIVLVPAVRPKLHPTG